MTTRQGVCTNTGRCRLADVKTVQEIGADDTFTCRLCGLPLAPPGGGAPSARPPGAVPTGASTPVAVTPAPVAAKAAPVAVKGAPVAVTPAPVAAKAAPVAVTPAPAAVKAAPVAVTPAPVAATATPVAVTAAPAVTPARPPGASAPGARAPGPVAMAAAAPSARSTGVGTPATSRPVRPAPAAAGAQAFRSPAQEAPVAVEKAVRATAQGTPVAVERGVRPPAQGTPVAVEKPVRPQAAAPAGAAARGPARGASAPAAAADVSSRFPLGASLGVLVFVVMAVFAFWLAQGGPPPRQPERAGVSPPPPVQPAPAAAPVQPAPGTASAQPGPGAAAVQVILRFAGSNTVGAQLAPALAQGYLASIGATGIQASGAGSAEASVQGTKDGAREAISISAQGSSTAFEALLAGSADIGMASRRVKPEEAQRLAAMGSMTSPANEHVVALDGIAVIVSKANPIAQLSREQLAAVFRGRASDWSQLKGQAGPIHAYAPDDRSGTSDLFQTLVLGNLPMAAGVKRLPSNQAVADAVVGDPGGIGLVGLPFVRGAKALAVAEGDAAPMIPNAFTLANEDYFLARRLYLYTDQASKNPHVSPFVEFALGPEGQAIVKKAGFVELTLKADSRPPPDGAPAGYVRLVAGARRLSTDFRFVAGSSRLDNRAMRDLDRVVEFLRDNELNGASVRLLGFADSHGGAAANQALARERAVRVAKSFAQRGVTGATIAGFGAALPVADNSTEIGRERNRRVEIWVTR